MDTNNISQPPETYCGVLIEPDREEKKAIRRQYIKAGFVIVFNIVLFNYVLMGLLYIICGITQGEVSSLTAMKKATLTVLSGNPLIETIVSIGIPMISETCSIFFGIKLLKLDLNPLFNCNGFNGKDILFSGTICMGMQMVSAIIVTVIDFFLNLIGLEATLPDFTANPDSVAANILLYSYVCLLGPLLEEILYRGVLLQSLKKYNHRFALIVSALIFGLMHQNYQQFVLGFLLGLILGAITLRSNSIIPSVIFHIFINTSSTLSNLAMQVADYDTFVEFYNGNVTPEALMSAEPLFIIVIILNAVVRYGFLFAAVPLIIIAIVKKRGVRKPTPAGKTRGWPILAQSWIWYVILAVYLYYNFVNIFLVK